MKNNTEQTVYRIAPCPAFDLEGTESWLTELAQNGLFLKKDGFCGAIAAFERKPPKDVRYRLEASEKPVGLMSETDASPEAIELSAACGWEYLGAHGQFFLYRTENPEARELNTDPQVQALAIQAVWKRQINAILSMLFWLLIYPFLFRKNGVILTLLHVGSFLTLSGLALSIWSFIRELRQALLLGKYRKKLRTGEQLEHKKDWKSRAYRHVVSGCLLGILLLCWAGLAIKAWSAAEQGIGEIPLSAYAETPPFATMAEFEPEGEYTLQDFKWTNTVYQRRDVLVPTLIAWDETASIRAPDGENLSGGLSVYYYQTVSPLLAQAGAWEYQFLARFNRNFEVLPLPDDIPVDSAFAYLDDAHFPTLILRKGNTLIRARFYQTGNKTIALNDWARIMAESIQE